MRDLISRRRLLGRVVTASVGATAFSVAAAAARAAGVKMCADLEAMDSGAKSMRTSLNYTEKSTDADKTCRVCAFFQAASEGCGTCQIFNGPANPLGHCDSWSQKG
jgi:hypothetical protein